MKGGIIIILLLVVAFIVHNVDSCSKEPPTQAQTLAVSNPVKSPIIQANSVGNSNSPVTQINQSSNVSLKNNSDNTIFSNQGNAVYQKGTNNQILSPIFSGGIHGQMNLPVNNGTVNIYNPIYTNPPDTELRMYITQLWETVKFASNGVLLTRIQLEHLTELLTKIDRRTEDVHKLPDGRTSFGGIVGGASSVYGSDRNSGIESYDRGDYQLALEQSQKGIEDFESSPSNFVDEMVTILPASKALSYFNAGVSASMLSSNELAYEYALKAVAIEPTPLHQALIVSTLGNLAIESYSRADYSNTFYFGWPSITNYESIKYFTNGYSFRNVKSVYNVTFVAANAIGRTNESKHILDGYNNLK